MAVETFVFLLLTVNKKIFCYRCVVRELGVNTKVTRVLALASTAKINEFHFGAGFGTGLISVVQYWA